MELIDKVMTSKVCRPSNESRTQLNESILTFLSERQGSDTIPFSIVHAECAQGDPTPVHTGSCQTLGPYLEDRS